MDGKEYIIVGDTDKYEGCLVYTCGTDRAHAEEVLDRMVTNPTKDDLANLAKHHNLRVEEVESKDCWWNDPFLAN